MIKKKLLILSAAVVSLAVGLLTTVSSQSSLAAYKLRGEEPEVQTYKLTISSFDMNNYDPNLELYTATTPNGNEIKFRIDTGMSGEHDVIENNCLFIGKGGYIRSHTEIKGISSVTMKYDILNGGSTRARVHVGNSPVDADTSYYFDMLEALRKDDTKYSQEDMNLCIEKLKQIGLDQDQKMIQERIINSNDPAEQSRLIDLKFKKKRTKETLKNRRK